MDINVMEGLPLHRNDSRDRTRNCR